MIALPAGSLFLGWPFRALEIPDLDTEVFRT